MIYQVSKVKNYGQWIERYVQAGEQAGRKKIFQPFLQEQFPLLMRQGNEIFFVNSFSKKIESLKLSI